VPTEHNAVHIHCPESLDDKLSKSLKTRFNRKNLKESDPTLEEQLALEMMLQQEQMAKDQDDESGSFQSLTQSEKIIIEQDMIKEDILTEIKVDMSKKGIRKISHKSLNRILS
jgi:hypothetical protein